MKKMLIASAAMLIAGSAWAGPWDNYSEADSSAFHRDYTRERSLAGQPGMGDRMGVRSDIVDSRFDRGPWDNYSESGSTAFHRDYTRERTLAGQPGVGDTMEPGSAHIRRVGLGANFTSSETAQSILHDVGTGY